MRTSSERNFILACLQSGRSDHARTRCLEMISGPLNWNRIVGTVLHARIASVFLHELQSQGLRDKIPPESLHRLEKHYYKTGYRNSLILEQVAHLTRLLAEAQVEVVLLKGAALLVEVWPDLSLREIADVDLLVHPEDLEMSERILLKNGFLPVENWRPAEYYRKQHHHLVPYFNPNAEYRLPFEIHHDIAQPKHASRLDMAHFWASSRTVRFNNASFRVLSPEDLLLHLCMDLAFGKAFLGQFRYLLDITQCMNRFGSALKWEYIVAAAGERDIANYIYYPLHFSKHLLEAAIPQTVLDQIGSRISVRSLSHHLLCHWIRRYSLVSSPEDSLIPLYKIRNFCRDILSDAGASERMKTVWREILTPKKMGDRIRSALHSA